MSRTNHTPEFTIHARSKRDTSRLGTYGISVFRPVEKAQVADTFDALKLLCGSVAISYRDGNGGGRETAVSLVEINEVKRQHAIGNVAVRDAMYAIYYSMPSLRKEVDVKPQGLRLFGRANSDFRSFGIIFDDESKEILLEERANALEILEGFADLACEFDWLKKTPHISLAKVPTSDSNIASKMRLGRIADALPDQIRLKRATLFSQSTN
jgi:hypothetical protein